MLFTDIIRTKRDGGELTDAQIRYFVDGLADESIPAEQLATWCGTISYEIVSRIHPSLPRIVV